jgi:hypothetical protein
MAGPDHSRDHLSPTLGHFRADDDLCAVQSPSPNIGRWRKPLRDKHLTDKGVDIPTRGRAFHRAGALCDACQSHRRLEAAWKTEGFPMTVA